MWTLVFVTSSLFAFGNATPFVIPKNISKLCKEHTSKDSYHYKTFFRIDSEDLNHIRQDADTSFAMHFGVQGSSNGHVLLSSVPNPGDNDPVYEIVIGGGSNSFTEIRRNKKQHSGNSAITRKILSPYEMRGFYITISTDGLVEFGNEGDVLPLLTYKDLDPLEIKYFSFTSWYGVTVKFLYDCPGPNSNTPTMNSQEEAPPPMSPSDQLKQQQMMSRPPWMSPQQHMDVSLGIKITSVKYNAFLSKLVTGMSVVVSWKDEFMSWDVAKFNGTTSIKYRAGQIWRPKFFIFNSDNGVFDAKNLGMIRVLNTGEAIFHFQTQTDTWCFDSSGKLSKWPHDDYLCSIVIQPWDAHDRISIKVMDPKDSKMQVYADIENIIQNEWEVFVKQMIIKPETWMKVYTSDDNNTNLSDKFILNMELSRRPTSYNIVFYTPLVALLVFILMSFWTEPLKMERIWFYTGCVIVIIMGLCYIDFLIPCHTMPSILVLYLYVLAGVLAALLLQVFLRTSIVEKMCNTYTVERILTSAICRVIFCLHAVQSSSNGGYMIQDDEEATVAPKDNNVEEMEREDQEVNSNVKDIAEIIDKVLFFAYTLTFGIMLAAHF